LRIERLSSGLPSSKFPLTGDFEKSGDGRLPFGLEAREHRVAQGGVLHQQRVALGDGDVGLAQHHVHVRQQGAEEAPLRFIRPAVAWPRRGRRQAPTAAPKPYQPGSIRRHWDHENTQGWRAGPRWRWSSLREAGRLPMLSAAISDMTVDSRNTARTPAFQTSAR
jgi:hypothetical protein